MKFNKLVKHILQEMYQFVGSCVEYCDDGNEVFKIVRQDEFSYGENTHYHDPELEISKRKFKQLTGIDVSDDHFTGYNSDYDVVFDYDPNTDIHKFYKI
jgi:hypothetical protein